MPAKPTDLTAPQIYNSLLRCFRRDDKAAPLFERIQTVPGLWVLELAGPHRETWSSWLRKVRRVLTRHKATLKGLRAGSKDYTLHVAMTTTCGLLDVVIPPSLSELLSETGINLEISYQSE